jgi:hypothetical protein
MIANFISTKKRNVRFCHFNLIYKSAIALPIRDERIDREKLSISRFHHQLFLSKTQNYRHNKALGQIEQFLANDCRAIQLLHQINVYTLCLWIQRIVINPLKFTRDYQNFYSNILD